MAATPPSRRGSDMRPERQRFLFHGRLPVGTISVIAGAPSKGKSTLGYHIAAASGVPTLFVTTEELDTTVWLPRATVAGVDMDLAWHHPEVKFSKKQEDFDHLVELVDAYGIQLIIVDPISNHLRGASIHQDEQVREVFEPTIIPMLKEKGIALLLQMHVLRSVSAKAHPLAAVPGGVASVAKAIYLFGDDPRPGADPNLSVLANAEKFNFRSIPQSLLFEREIRETKVYDTVSKRWYRDQYPAWLDRGEVAVQAKQIIVKLAPQKKESKSDRVAIALLRLLAEGPVSTSILRQHFLEMDPPITWRTVERVKNEMDLDEHPDPNDGRSKLWSLPSDILDEVEDADDIEEDIEITEIDRPDIPDTIPDDWMDDEGAAA